MLAVLHWYAALWMTFEVIVSLIKKEDPGLRALSLVLQGPVAVYLWISLWKGVAQ